MGSLEEGGKGGRPAPQGWGRQPLAHVRQAGGEVARQRREVVRHAVVSGPSHNVRPSPGGRRENHTRPTLHTLIRSYKFIIKIFVTNFIIKKIFVTNFISILFILSENLFCQKVCFVRKSVFRKSVFRKSVFRKSVFRKSFFRKSFFRKSFFRKSFFRKSVFRKSVFRKSVFRKSVFRKSVFRKSVFRKSVFRKSVFRKSVFRKSVFRKSVFRKSVFRKSVFRKSVFRKSVFRKSVFAFHNKKFLLFLSHKFFVHKFVCTKPFGANKCE